MSHRASRQYWADYTKAFAIWLMVICHFGLRPQSLVDIIYVFHMPVFFLISGYFDNGNPFSKKKLKMDFKKIMVPYFFFSACSFSICWISPYIHPEIYHHGTLLQTFAKAFIGMFMMEDQVRPYAFMPTGALWFLVALFNIKIVFSILCLCWNKCKYVIPIMCIAVSFVVYLTVPFFSLDSAFIALPFYIIGYFLKRYNILEWPKKRWEMLLISGLCWVYTAIWGVRNGNINIDGCVIGNHVILFYLNGIIGSLACIYLFRFVNFESRHLQSIGAGTLTILGTHGYINKLMTIIAILWLGVAPSEIPIWYIILSSFIALYFGILVEKLLTKYYPSMIGKSSHNRAEREVNS